MSDLRFSAAVWLAILSTFSIPLATCAASPDPFAELPAQDAWHDVDGEAVLLDADKPGPATLLIRKDALRAGPVALRIETDAASVTLRSAGGAAKVRLVPDNGALDLLADASAPRPSLKVSGSEPAEHRGRWLQICLREEEPKLALEFEKATHCTVRVASQDPPAAARDELPAQRVMVKTAPPELPDVRRNAPADEGPAPTALARTKQSVFQVRVKDDQQQVYGEGTGFLTDDQGFALTNFHVIQGAASAEARFEDVDQPFDVELVAVRPELDLALLRLVDLKPRGDFAPTALRLSGRSPNAGSDVWAIGYPKGLGFSINRGVVNGVRRLSQLPEEMRSAMRDYKESSRWVQTDCPINSGNSGGPLIDSSGTVVGINTWLWLDGNNLFFALSAQDAQEFAAARPKTDLTFASAKEKYKGSKTAWTVVPSSVPVVDVPEATAPDGVVGATRAMSTSVVTLCRVCKGDGKVTVRVKTGYSDSGGGMARPVYRNRERPCETCGGAGGKVATPEAINRLAANLVTAVATVKRSDPTLKEQMAKAYGHIRESCKYLEVREALHATANGRFAQKSVELKTPVMCTGILLASGPLPNAKEVVHVVILGDTGHLVVISRPILEDRAFKGAAVIVGGYYAGDSNSLTGQPLRVLQNGFIVKDDAGIDVYDIGRD